VADRAARSVLEFVTAGDKDVLATFDKIDQKSKKSGESVSAFGRQFGTMLAAFSAASLIDRAGGMMLTFGQNVFESASHVLDLSNKTGLATETIQQMQNVADQTGTSLESLTQASFKLGVNIAKGTTDARDAVRDLKLSYEDLKNQRPDAQFAQVMKALEGVNSQQERNRLGVALFGKQFTEMAASVQEGYSKIAAAATITSREQLEALDAVGDAWTQFKDDVAANARTAAGSIVLYFREAWAAATIDMSKYADAERSRIADALGSGQIGDLTRVLGEVAKARRADIELSSAQAETNVVLSEALAHAREELAHLTAAERANLDAAILMGSTYEIVGRNVHISEEAFNLYKKQVQEATQATKQHTTEQEKLATQTRGYYNWLGEREISAVQAMQDRVSQQEAEWRQYYNWLGERRMEDEASAIASQQRIAQGAAAMFQSMMASASAWNGSGAWMLRGTVPMNSPSGGGGSALSGGWGQLLGGGLGMLSGLIPGQSRTGAAVGSLGGSLLTSLFPKIASALGPLGGILGGLAGGLLGKLFGPSEADKTRTARNEWVESVGGLDKIKEAAAAAGVSLDALFGARKVKDFEAEAKRVMSAIEAHQQKVLALQQQQADLEAQRDQLVKDTTVTWKNLQDLSERFGINQQGLGQTFQQGRLTADAQEITDALAQFQKGDADMGTVLFGMRDEFSQLVRDSVAFKTTIPENLKPFIDHLLETGNLLDENGQAMKELPEIKFGDALTSQLQTAEDKLADVVDRLADVLSQLADLDHTHVNFSVNGTYTNTHTTTGDGSDGEGFASGTWGRMGNFWGDFGRGMRTTLHGVEAVVRPSQALGFARSVLGSMGDAAQVPLIVQMDGAVAARAMVRRTGRTLALVGV